MSPKDKPGVSPTLAINQRALEMRRMGKDIVHLGFGQSPFPVYPALERELRRQAHQAAYIPTAGLPELKEAVCRFFNDRFGYSFTPEGCLVGPGSKELLYGLFGYLPGPMIHPCPSWVSYAAHARLWGKKLHLIETSHESGYKITPDDLKAAVKKLGKGPKVLILNTPSNPTGQMYSHAELKALAAVCRKGGIVVVSDEIYALTAFSVYHGMAHVYPEGTIVTTGLSKAFSAGGYRLGFALIPKELMGVRAPMVSLMSETFSCASAPIQHAALAAFRDPPDFDRYLSHCVKIHKAVLDYLQSELIEGGTPCLKAQGGFYLFPERILAKGDTSEALCERLLAEAGVAALPGTAFGLPASRGGLRLAAVDYDGKKALAHSLQGAAVDRHFVEKYCPLIVEGARRLRRFFS